TGPSYAITAPRAEERVADWRDIAEPWRLSLSLRAFGLRWESALLLGCIALASLVFTWALLAQHRAYNSNGWDLGWFDQVVWNTAHGRPFENSFAPWSFLGEHLEPVLLLFALIYRVKPDVEILLVTQALVGA